MTTMIDKSKRFCMIVANDYKDPHNNSFKAIDNITVQDERAGKWDSQYLKYDIIKPTFDVEKYVILKKAVNIFMTMWDIEINMDLKPSKDNPEVRIYFKSSVEEPYFKERPSTLAFAYYPSQGAVSGIMVFNDDYWWNNNGEDVEAYRADPIHYVKGDGKTIKGYNLVSIGGHEFGHCLGLTHSVLNDSDDLMRPYYDPNVLWISLNDIARVLLKYTLEVSGGAFYNSRMRAWLRHTILKFKRK